MFASLSVPALVFLLSAPTAPEAPAPERAPPRVVETFPAHGAHIQPGLIEMRVTFDRPMSGQISIAQPGGEYHLVQMPCGDVRQSEDLRSFTQSCQAIAGAQHTVLFGGDNIPNFIAKDGSEARPFILSFTVAR